MVMALVSFLYSPVSGLGAQSIGGLTKTVRNRAGILTRGHAIRQVVAKEAHTIDAEVNEWRGDVDECAPLETPECCG